MNNRDHRPIGIELISEQIIDLKRLVEFLIVKCTTINESPWFDLLQATEYTTISTSQLRRLVSQRRIRASRIDPKNKRSKLIFFKPDLDQFLLLGHNRRLSKSEKAELVGRMSGLTAISNRATINTKKGPNMLAQTEE